MKTWQVTWSFDIEVEAETKHEAEQKARELFRDGVCDLEIEEIVAQDALQITEIDPETGDPI